MKRLILLLCIAARLASAQSEGYSLGAATTGTGAQVLATSPSLNTTLTVTNSVSSAASLVLANTNTGIPIFNMGASGSEGLNIKYDGNGASGHTSVLFQSIYNDNAAEMQWAMKNGTAAMRLFGDGGFSVGGSASPGTGNMSATKFKFLTNTTGAGSAALGANSPATTNTAPYTWITSVAADGSTVYIPCWK